ncbi:MAG: hypothetical protein ACYTAF_00275 [Planctomycetota bacterium]|jgi:hypothetical protein
MDGREIAEKLLAGADVERLKASDDAVEIARAVGAVMRAAVLLGLERLAGAADEFPASIRGLMRGEAPDPFGFADLVDLLSDEGLECVSPRLHQGWQDRTQSCRTARAAGRKAAGFGIDAETREALLAGLVLHNRVFRLPPPAQLDAAGARRALSAVFGLVGRLKK